MSAKAGDNIGILLRGVKRDFVRRGMFLCKPDSLIQTDAVRAQLYIRTKQEGEDRNHSEPTILTRLVRVATSLEEVRKKEIFSWAGICVHR